MTDAEKKLLELVLSDPDYPKDSNQDISVARFEVLSERVDTSLRDAFVSTYVAACEAKTRHRKVVAAIGPVTPQEWQDEAMERAGTRRYIP